MNRALSAPVRVLVGLAATLAVALPAVPALGQTTAATTTQMSIDSPAANSTVTNGSQVDVGGWAADPAGPGTGVDMVRVYLDNRMDAGGTLLGDANYGSPRPDVGAALGNPAMANSGFNYTWTPTNVTSGQHTLYVYAHSIANSWAYKTVAVTLQVQPTPTPGPRAGQYGPGPYGGGGPYPSPYDSTYYGPSGPGYAPGYGGYPGMYGPGPYPMVPPPPVYPGYPTDPGTYPPGGRVCIMIYPPPPGC